MRRRHLGMLLLGLLIGAGASPAFAADSLRCGGALIQIDDPAITVQQKCGPPSFTDPFIGGTSDVYGGPPMDEWTYNFGPGQLMDVIVFRGGKVVDIHSDGYGFRPGSQPGRCTGGFIATGMSKYRLLDLCGAPAQQSGGFIYSSVVRDGAQDYYLRRGVFPVFRERWIYNFGPDQLLREITLENAVVVETRTLDQRGFR